MDSLSSICFDDVNLYRDNTFPYPNNNTKADNSRCFFALSNQYNTKAKLRMISNGTAKLNTDRNAKSFGGR